MSDNDLVIVGGGPVGLVAAIEARMLGMDVTLIEQRCGSIDKACGEGLMPGAVPMLERLGVNPAGHELVGVTYRNERVSVSHRFRHGAGRGVRRTELSDALRARAQDLGVRFVHAAVESIEQDESNVVAACSNGEHIRGSYLVGADGLHSRVAKLAGLSATSRTHPKRRYGIRQHYSVPPWSNFIEVFYTDTAEVYITPVSASEIGVAVLGPRATNFEETISSIPELAGRLDGVSPSSERAGAGPFSQETVARTAGRVLLVGDASGYVDAITGEGLRLGFAQAHEAISCIAAGKPTSYERQWRRVSRDFRVLTRGLATLANSPLRTSIVPLAHQMPRLFGYIVDRLAR